jgi:hypothetical protein
MSSYEDFCEGRDSAQTFRNKIHRSINAAKHLVKVKANSYVGCSM